MEQAPDRVETARLVIRAFTPDDWRGVQELATDFMSSDAAKYDHAWPTSEEGCKGAVGYFMKRKGSSWAVCLKAKKRLIGYISFNDINKDKELDFGHVFHREFSRDDYDTEAIARMMDYAFTHLDIESIDCKNAEDWTVQVAPLRKLGLTVIGRGKGSFHKNPDGTPIEFTGIRMGTTREEWQRRGCGIQQVKVRTDGTKVFLQGIQPMTWGGGQMCEFASALTRTLSCVGEDVSYHYCVGVTGVAFRFTFGPEHWNPGFYGFDGVSADVNDLIRRAFAAVGYEYTHYTKAEMAEDRKRIIESIDRGVTVMVRGHLVDASDWALVGGYDREDGNVLFASSPYGKREKAVDCYDAAPDWHAKTKQYIILGAKCERPPAEAVYTDALRLAVKLVRAPKVRDRYTGLKAMEVLAATLREEEFPEDAERKEDKPGFRYLCLLCYNMMLDDHKSAPPFLRDAAKALPACATELAKASVCYERSGKLRDRLDGVLPGNFSKEAQKRVLDPRVRGEFADILLKIRDAEEEGISHIERALAKIGTVPDSVRNRP